MAGIVVSTLLQFSCNLAGKYHAVGYYSYTHRYVQFAKKSILNYKKSDWE